MDFERKLPTEQQDIADIVAGILAVQTRFAGRQKRPLGRGTHTKGVCVRATFEVFDVAKTIDDAALGRGSGARPVRETGHVSGNRPVRERGVDVPPRLGARTCARCRSPCRYLPASSDAQPVRFDFSMNNAPTFPINDAHAFAAFMRVQAASSPLGQLRRLLSLPFRDLKGFFPTAANGLRQQHTALQPYQQTRYWSNVPFLHGEDEAMKYLGGAAFRQYRPADGKGQNVLRDELARHLTEDPPARFDFAMQLLDAVADDHQRADAASRASGSRTPASSGPRHRRRSTSSAG